MEDNELNEKTNLVLENAYEGEENTESNSLTAGKVVGGLTILGLAGAGIGLLGLLVKALVKAVKKKKRNKYAEIELKDVVDNDDNEQ